MKNDSSLKKILFEISTPEERQQLATLDMEKKVEEVQSSMKNLAKSDEVTMSVAEVQREMRKMQSNYEAQSNQSAQAFREMKDALLKSLADLHLVFKSQEFDKNAGPLYKAMIDGISGVTQAVNDKQYPVWRWPQYAAVSVRNKNFANINPSISPFGISDYDDVVLSDYDADGNVGTVTYSLNGNQTAVLSLSYDASGNLTEVQRTS